MTNRPESTGDLSGRRLGVYQIEARIGAGGMGEVYRARDTNLGRDVAIKVGVRVDPRGDTWGAGNPVKVVEGPYRTLGGTALTYGVSPDGQRFLMVKQAPASQTSAPQIIVVQNRLEELKRLAPVR